MKKLEVDKTYILKEFWGGGKELARVSQVKGIFRKRYKVHVWGIHPNGTHDWPNGNVSSYENWLSADEVKKAKPYGEDDNDSQTDKL